MMQKPRYQTLSCRLIDRYLMFGLAGIFVCLAVAIGLYFLDMLTHFAPALAIAPLGILLGGAVVLRRSVRFSSQIEEQLFEASRLDHWAGQALSPVQSSEAPAQAWNRMLQHAASAQRLAEIEQKLNRTVAEFRRNAGGVLDHLPDGVAVSDSHGMIRYANPAFCALVKLRDADEAQQRPMADLLSAQAASPDEVKVLAESTLADHSFDIQSGGDESAVLRVVRRELPDDHSQLWQVRDITQSRLAEQMRNQFVFTVTHELRTPLANIKAYAETLALTDDIDVEQQKEFYNVLNAEATRLARFVDELLDITQMEAGALSLVWHETDLERLVAEVAEKVEPQIAQKQLEFKVNVPAKLPKLQLDKDKFIATLINLVGNAVKYTPPGGSVSLNVELGAGQVHFHVEDTGIGISAEELPKVWNRFFRSSDSRVRKISGSGLGLALVQEVVRLHGGQFSVASELNKGSCFTITVPVK